ncbi:MAG: SIS domain-containing protein [Spirochaetales bacterium]|nr:SIS domain-containing protein [Spirochaetales bacterium]
MTNWKSDKYINPILEDFESRYPRMGRKMVEPALDILIPSVEAGAVIYTCGNGGSAADADHIVGELMKGFVMKRLYGDEFRKDLEAADPERGAILADSLEQGIPSICLNATGSLISAFANDVNYEMAFAQQLAVLGNPGDILWCLSTSGNSTNILYAATAARARGMKIISMTSESGGKLKGISDCCLNVPETETHKAQECHLPLYHCLCLCLEAYFFAEAEAASGGAQ